MYVPLAAAGFSLIMVEMNSFAFSKIWSAVKVTFTPEQIYENAKEFIQTILKLKPAAAKGTYIKSIFISSTMSAGIKVDPKSVE